MAKIQLQISRRNFLKSALAGSGGLALAGREIRRTAAAETDARYYREQAELNLQAANHNGRIAGQMRESYATLQKLYQKRTIDALSDGLARFVVKSLN